MNKDNKDDKLKLDLTLDEYALVEAIEPYFKAKVAGLSSSAIFLIFSEYVHGLMNGHSCYGKDKSEELL